VALTLGHGRGRVEVVHEHNVTKKIEKVDAFIEIEPGDPGRPRLYSEFLGRTLNLARQREDLADFWN